MQISNQDNQNEIRPGQYCRAQRSFGLIDQGIYRYEGIHQGIAYLTAGAEVVGICPSFLSYFAKVSAADSAQKLAQRQQNYRTFLVNKLTQHGVDKTTLLS